MIGISRSSLETVGKRSLTVAALRAIRLPEKMSFVIRRVFPGNVSQPCHIRAEIALRLSGGHQRAQAAGAFRGAQLPQRFGLNLANALARDVEFLADLFQGVLALTADAEPHPDYFLLLRGKRLQNAGGFVANVGFDDG